MKNVRDLHALQFNGLEMAAGRSRSVVGLSTALVDFLTIVAIVLFASAAYHITAYRHFGDIYLTAELAVFLGCIFFFTNLLQRRYRLTRYLTFKGQMVDAFNAWNVTIVAFIAIGFLGKIGDNYSRAVVILTYLTGIPLITLARWWLVKLISVASKTGLIAAQRVLLIGREADVAMFMNRHQPWNTALIVQDMVILHQATGNAPPAEAHARLQADLAVAVASARHNRPDGVMIVLPWSEREQIELCINAFMNLPVSINLAPDKVLDRFDNPRIIRIGSIATLELAQPPLSLPQIVVKRLFDLAGAALLLLILAPLFAVVAVLIKLDSKGPVLFRQRRYGFNQQPFRILKFRSMTCMDDGDVVRQAQKGDPRITRVGAWLRRYNLDELPQLMNVLQGHMSLVGPRPHAVAHDHEFEQKIGLYARRHNVRPGITGWAQVHGLRGETDTDDKMAKRVSFDLWYIDNWNVWLDIIIMLRTVLTKKAFSNAH